MSDFREKVPALYQAYSVLVDQQTAGEVAKTKLKVSAIFHCSWKEIFPGHIVLVCVRSSVCFFLKTMVFHTTCPMWVLDAIVIFNTWLWPYAHHLYEVESESINKGDMK